MEAEAALVEEEEIIPLYADFGPAMFQPYVLDLAGLGFASPHTTHCMACVVLTRANGVLLALPELAVPGDALARGDTADAHALVGPHLKLDVGAAMLDDVSVLQEPSPVVDRSVSAELVDFSAEVLRYLRSIEEVSEVMSALSFDYREPLLIPAPEILVARARMGKRRVGLSGGENLVLLGRRGATDTWPPRRRFGNTQRWRRTTGADSNASAGKHSAWWRKRRTTSYYVPTEEEAHSRIIGSEFGANQSDASGFGQPSAGPILEDCSNGSNNQAGDRQIISLAKAHWQLDYAWITKSLQLEELGGGDASAQGNWGSEAEGGLHSTRHGRLSWWAYLVSIGFEEAVLNSCAFGSIHKKPFRLLGWGLDMARLRVPCPGGHQHVRIAGKYTKPSAVYHPGVAAHIAACFAEALARSDAEADVPEGPRLESLVINDILLQDGWSTLAHWHWRKPGHINILESRAFVA